ncbi:MAG: hypothetical protein ACE5EA_02080 [Nitrospirota bacterium]
MLLKDYRYRIIKVIGVILITAAAQFTVLSDAKAITLDFSGLNFSYTPPASPVPISGEFTGSLTGETDVLINPAYQDVSGWGNGWDIYYDFTSPKYTNWGVGSTFIYSSGNSLSIVFAQPVDMTSMDLIVPVETGITHPGDIKVTAGLLSDTISGLTTANLPYTFSSDWTNITALSFQKNMSTGIFALDNLTFEYSSAPIPEPGTISLMISGLFSLYYCIEKRRKV